MRSYIRVGYVMPGARGVRGRGPSRRALAEAEHGRGAGGDIAQPRREGARSQREQGRSGAAQRLRQDEAARRHRGHQEAVVHAPHFGRPRIAHFGYDTRLCAPHPRIKVTNCNCEARAKTSFDTRFPLYVGYVTEIKIGQALIPRWGTTRDPTFFWSSGHRLGFNLSATFSPDTRSANKGENELEFEDVCKYLNAAEVAEEETRDLIDILNRKQVRRQRR